VEGAVECHCTVSEQIARSLTEVVAVVAPVQPRTVSSLFPPGVQPLLSESPASSQNQFAYVPNHERSASLRAPAVLGSSVLLLEAPELGQEVRNWSVVGLGEGGQKRRENDVERLSHSLSSA